MFNCQASDASSPPQAIPINLLSLVCLFHLIMNVLKEVIYDFFWTIVSIMGIFIIFIIAVDLAYHKLLLSV